MQVQHQVAVHWIYKQTRSFVEFFVTQNQPITYGAIFRHVQNQLHWILPPVLLELRPSPPDGGLHFVSRREVDLEETELVNTPLIGFCHLDGALSELVLCRKTTEKAVIVRQELQQITFPLQPNTFIGSVTRWLQQKADSNKYFNQQIIDTLYRKVILPWFHHAFKAKPHGVLFYGPPGTGKTEISSIFEEFFHTTNPKGNLSATRFFRPLVGQTEQAMRDEVSICLSRPDQTFVMILDEFDSLGADRSNSGEEDHKADFLNQLLAIIGSKEYHNLLLVACTNFKEKLDPAILRDGRLDLHIFVPPLSPDERLQTLRNTIPNLRGLSQPETDPFLQLTVNFTAGQFSRLMKEINDFKEFNELEWSGDLLLYATKEYLKMQERPNLSFNALQLSNDQHTLETVAGRNTLYNGYKQALSAHLMNAKQKLFSFDGQASGRFILRMGLRPFLEVETCQPLHSLPKVVPPKTVTFQLLWSQEDMVGPVDSNVYHMAQPLLREFNIQYVQVIDHKTIPSGDQSNFSQFLKSKLTECEESPVPSLILIFVDQIIGSTPHFSHQTSAHLTHQFGRSSSREHTSTKRMKLGHERLEDTINTSNMIVGRTSSVDDTTNTHHAAITSQLQTWQEGRSMNQTQESNSSVNMNSDSSWNFNASSEWNSDVQTSHGSSHGSTKTKGKKQANSGQKQGAMASIGTGHTSQHQQNQTQGQTWDQASADKMDIDKNLKTGLSATKRTNSGQAVTNLISEDTLSSWTIEKSKSATDSCLFSTSKEFMDEETNTTFHEFTHLHKNVLSQSSEPQQNDILNSISILLRDYVNYQHERKPFIALVIETPLTYKWMKHSLKWGKIPPEIPSSGFLYRDMMEVSTLHSIFSKCAFTLTHLEMRDSIHLNQQGLVTPAFLLHWIANMDKPTPRFIFPFLKNLVLQGSLDFSHELSGVIPPRYPTSPDHQTFLTRLEEAFPSLTGFRCTDTQGDVFIVPFPKLRQ